MHTRKMVVLFAGLLFAGCATVPPPKEVAELPPEEVVSRQADTAREAKGIVALAQATSLTLPMAQDKAIRRVRTDLGNALVARVEKLQADFVATAGIADVGPVAEWFGGVSRYLRDLTPGVRPVFENTQVDGDLFTYRVLLVADPGVIAQALEVRGASNRQLFELLRASQAYRELLAEIEVFGQYRVALGRSDF
jgi:hypothetical protein